jgi:hypothetical protein
LYIGTGFIIGGEMGKAQIEAQNTLSSSYEPIAKDSKTGALKVVDIEHAIIHDGRGYTCSDITSIANAATRDMIITNPTSLEAHLRVWEWDFSAAPGKVFLYEGPFTVEASGTACTLQNNDRNSSNTSSIGIYDVASVTITSSTQLLEAHLITGGKQDGGSTPSAAVEWELKSNTQYLMRAVNDSGGALVAGYYFFLIEPEGS